MGVPKCNLGTRRRRDALRFPALRCSYERNSVSNDSRESFTGVQVRSDSEPGVGENGWGHGKNYIVVLVLLGLQHGPEMGLLVFGLAERRLQPVPLLQRDGRL